MGHRGNGVTWQAPGRVNLIGEHTDYNAGYVLPFAIEQACAATVERLDECRLVIRSAQRADQAHLPYDRLQPGAAVGWAGYAAGVVWAMRQRGADLPACGSPWTAPFRLAPDCRPPLRSPAPAPRP